MQFVNDSILAFATSPLTRFNQRSPWELTGNALEAVHQLLEEIGASYHVVGAVAVHHTAVVEDQAMIKGPAIIGPNCFIAANSLIRGGCWLDEGCIVGPGCELKSSFIFRSSKLAHFNFVGDSIVGSAVNLEAGSIVANYRNELPDPTIRILRQEGVVHTGVSKFGALIGDGCKIGANAVIAPGAILGPNTVVPRLALVDQYPSQLI
jgi:UDP-N-acetylglucosamine diphosphorylase / glucose-1-phosphate thymidylyltransferase / UDP-N-acetylgalactosamine diphosphorylase / glucosamine-1-phosphate N-acetyltransferase / galactosamine-1-phosphate N-acetyltransferase